MVSFNPENSVAEASAFNETAVMLDLDSKSVKSCDALPSDTLVLVVVVYSGKSPVDRLCAGDIGPCMGMTVYASEDGRMWERSDDACMAAVGVAVSERGISQGGGAVRTSGDAGFW